MIYSKLNSLLQCLILLPVVLVAVRAKNYEVLNSLSVEDLFWIFWIYS